MLLPPRAELATELNDFRTSLGQAWIRRATRMLSLEGVNKSSVREAQTYRDQEWIDRER